MIKVALTGGVASGKSTVAVLMREAGLPVLDSDTIARQVVAPGKPAWQALRQNFPEEFFRPDGSVDRQALARHVFTRPEARHKLNRILHPYIARELQDNLSRLQSRGEPLVVVEIPLLFELGLETLYDSIIVVYSDLKSQKQRLARRDPREADEVEGILTAQGSLRQKAAQADFVVDNSGSIAGTREQVKKIVAQLRKLLDKKG
jgi:dephospho-CoA kinase